MDERREEAKEIIRYYVWSGYYDSDEIFDIVDEEIFESDGENDSWIRKAIRREFQKKQKSERDWPKITDCDRLDRVFEVLRARRILTRHRCGLTIQDGLDVVDGLYQEEGGKRSEFIGYCFYHLQDMEMAMWGDGGIFLAFGSFSRNRKQGIEIGQQIRKELESSGFEVVWDGTIDSRLLLKGFRWRRRGASS